MSANLDALVNGIRDKRREKLPQAKERLVKLQNAKQSVIDAKSKVMQVTGSNPEVQANLYGLPYDQTLSMIDAAIEASENAVSRLSRESINIGVAGKARQGKSQILQMLTGLSDKQIPTGDGGYCTGSRSVIRNSENNLARIYFKKEADLMEQIILPLCRSLKVSPCPGSVRAFMEATLPEQQKDAVKASEWKNLNDLHRDLNNNPGLKDLLGSQPQEVGFGDLRKYVTKDEGDKLFQVVDHVYVETGFDSGLPKGMLVFDLPGLEDPAKGVCETMLTSIKEDADIVFLMRMPSVMGDDWGTGDIDINQQLQSIYAGDDIDPKDWILLVMNHVREHKKIGKDGKEKIIPDNEENLDRILQEEIPARCPGFHAVKCDCGSKEAVRMMVNDNVEVLIQQTSRIDDLRISQADAKFAGAMSAVRSLADAFSSAVGQSVAQSGGFDYDDHWKKFKAALRGPFKKSVDGQLGDMQQTFKASLKGAFGAAYKAMKKIYEECESAPNAKFPSEFPVVDKEGLVIMLEGEDSTAVAIARAARNQLNAVVGLLRAELQGCCEELRAIYLSNVVKSVTNGNAAIQALLQSVPEQERSTPAGVVSVLKNRLEEGGGSMGTVVSALENLLHFDVSYETQLLPYLFDCPEFVEKLDPDSPNSDLGKLADYLNKEFRDDFNGQADVLFNSLKNYSLNWIAPLANARSEGPCEEVSKGIMRVVKANYRNFVALFVWGVETVKEWKSFTRTNAATLWPAEFDKSIQQSQIGKQLRDIVTMLRKAAA